MRTGNRLNIGRGMPRTLTPEELQAKKERHAAALSRRGRTYQTAGTVTVETPARPAIPPPPIAEELPEAAEPAPVGASRATADMEPASDATENPSEAPTAETPSEAPTVPAPMFLCGTCGKAFATVRARAGHMRVHKA